MYLIVRSSASIRSRFEPKTIGKLRCDELRSAADLTRAYCFFRSDARARRFEQMWRNTPTPECGRMAFSDVTSAVHGCAEWRNLARSQSL
jgi:hypothetical protein